MPSRAERRRRSRTPDRRASPGLSRELAGAIVLAVSVAVFVGAALLLSGGRDGGDDAAITSLARKSIEVMPRNEWPTLYDDFTSEFQTRCPEDQFVQSGIDAAQEQGPNLPLLAFVRLEDMSIQGDEATATIIGEVKGSFEYEVYAAFQRQEGVWKLSPPEGTSGCQAFNRP